MPESHRNGSPIISRSITPTITAGRHSGCALRQGASPGRSEPRPRFYPLRAVLFSRLVAIGTNSQTLPSQTDRFRGPTQHLENRAFAVGAQTGVIVLGPVADGAGTSEFSSFALRLHFRQLHPFRLRSFKYALPLHDSTSTAAGRRSPRAWPAGVPR